MIKRQEQRGVSFPSTLLDTEPLVLVVFTSFIVSLTLYYFSCRYYESLFSCSVSSVILIQI